MARLILRRRIRREAVSSRNGSEWRDEVMDSYKGQVDHK